MKIKTLKVSSCPKDDLLEAWKTFQCLIPIISPSNQRRLTIIGNGPKYLLKSKRCQKYLPRNKNPKELIDTNSHLKMKRSHV